MRSVQRNKQTIYYAQLLGHTEVTDEYGNATGEFVLQYSSPQPLRINIGSPKKGDIILERFGLNENYQRILATTDMNCPLKDDTIVWIGIPTTKPYNYVVKKILPSLNQLLIGLEEVNGETVGRTSLV